MHESKFDRFVSRNSGDAREHSTIALESYGHPPSEAPQNEYKNIIFSISSVALDASWITAPHDRLFPCRSILSLSHPIRTHSNKILLCLIGLLPRSGSNQDQHTGRN